MTLECETEFPKVLKESMKTMGFNGEAVYKGFPVMDEDQEYWWVELHLYQDKEDDHKTTGRWMFTNKVLETSFFDASRRAAWRAIEELSRRIRFRMHNTQGYLKDVEKELEELKKEIEKTNGLKTTVNQLMTDMVNVDSELCNQEDQKLAKDTRFHQ